LGKGFIINEILISYFILLFKSVISSRDVSAHPRINLAKKNMVYIRNARKFNKVITHMDDPQKRFKSSLIRTPFAMYGRRKHHK